MQRKIIGGQMKLLEKTIFKRKNEKIDELTHILQANTECLEKFILKNEDLQFELAELNENNAKLTQIINNEKAETKKYSGRCGGLTKQINKLLKENEELKNDIIKLRSEYEEFKKGKYIVRELKPEKAPKTQKIRIKSGQKTSDIIAKIKNNDSAEEN